MNGVPLGTTPEDEEVKLGEDAGTATAKCVRLSLEAALIRVLQPLFNTNEKGKIRPACRSFITD